MAVRAPVVSGLRAVRLLGVLALAGTFVVTACGGREVIPVSPAAPRAATLQDLLGPWQATPLAVDSAWRTTIETTCRREVESPRAQVGIVDVRGGGVATVRLTRPQVAKCDALRITPEGRVEGAGGGMSGLGDAPRPERPVHIGRVEEGFVLGGELVITGWSVMGAISADVAAVEVTTPLYPPITASLENGWFSAWWPAPRGDLRPGQGVMPPYRIRALDARGAILVEMEGR